MAERLRGGPRPRLTRHQGAISVVPHHFLWLQGMSLPGRRGQGREAACCVGGRFAGRAVRNGGSPGPANPSQPRPGCPRRTWHVDGAGNLRVAPALRGLGRGAGRLRLGRGAAPERGEPGLGGGGAVRGLEVATHHSVPVGVEVVRRTARFGGARGLHGLAAAADLSGRGRAGGRGRGRRAAAERGARAAGGVAEASGADKRGGRG